ncbi:hypothetical protein cypCar_00004300 [Cyprinus carpio]|nr:hypothetical protein cypCar_00004300 [Cyprinus carpio]
MYVVNLLIPSCFLIALDLFSFLLPPQNVDRSAFKMTLILGYTVFLLLMNDLLPVTGNTLPLINVFFSLCLALMVASLLETILITNIQCGSTHYGPLPSWAKMLFLNYLAKLVCLSKKPSDQNCDPEVRDVHILFSEPGEATLKKSLQYMETKGEWQLTDVIARKSANSSYFNMDGLDKWDEIIYHVCVTFTLMVASLLETIVITNILCGSSDYPPLPNWVKVLFLHYLARLVCLRKKVSDQNSDPQKNTKGTISCSLEKEISQIRYPEKGIKSPLNHEQELKELRNIHKDVLTIRQQVDKHFSTDQNSEEWIHLGEVIDRFLFALYVIFLTVSFFTILIFWMYWYSFDKKS